MADFEIKTEIVKPNITRYVVAYNDASNIHTAEVTSLQVITTAMRNVETYDTEVEMNQRVLQLQNEILI